MATKILKNTTGTDESLVDLGITVTANSQVTLNPTDYPDAAASDELVELIGDGTLIVNDGNQDLGKAQGIALIQGGFVKTDFEDDLLESNRLKVDVTGTLSDGRIKVSDNDATANFLDAKITTGSSKITKVVNNEGSSEEVQLDVDPTQINTTDLNNDAGFITSGQAPVQPVDIANFETSTELDVRDTDNRDRTNHTGTQLASTISDFTTAVQSSETVTNLTFNSSTNVLTYTNEAGTNQTVDLTQYLDDTNLARIVNGTLNSSTGITTFTRDDSTTFTIDMSSLLDDQNASEVPFTPTGTTTSNNVQDAIVEIQTEVDLNTVKISADGSINTHSDVDVTTIAPTTGDLLQWDGSNFVPVSTSNGHTIFPIWAEESGGLASNNRQWSFGNGATGNINIVLPVDAELFAVSFDAENGGAATVIMDVYKNDVPFHTTKEFTLKDFETLPTVQNFAAGDCIGFRTNTENGSVSDARVCAWLRIRSSALSTSVLNDLLDVSISGITTGQALVWNGSNFTNQTVVLNSSLATVATTGDYNDLNNRPILGTAADNDEGDFATAAQGTLASTAVQPNDNISDLTNDAGYITLAQSQAGAPVQASDIANFETSSQLNTRDAANRNRANHTGTQLAATISDFNSSVQNAETVTNLTFNSSTNTLTFTNEAGTVQNIDLTQFLDDTNLARITSGSLNATTGIATFTRDDSTTFTIDMSSLNDQAFINSAISTHEVSITNHNDVNTVGASTGDLLVYNGSTWIPKRKQYKKHSRSTTPLMNQTTTLENYLQISDTIPETGLYKITWSYTWSINTTTNDFIGQVNLNSGTILFDHQQEAKDSAGTGSNVTTTTGGTVNTSTNQKMAVCGEDIVTLTAGAFTLDLDFAGELNNLEPTIYRALITIEEWEE